LVDLFGIGKPDLLAKGDWRRDRGYGPDVKSLRVVDLDLKGPDLWEWVGPRTGILVYGRNKPQEVDGSVLFGNQTFGKSWEHGYEPLATLDQDGDKVLKDKELNALWLWLDLNSDAGVQAGEMLAAKDYVQEISVDFNTDGKGNFWQDKGVILKDGKTVQSWDWWSKPLNPSKL
jgi:hypothetical protein